MNHGRTEGPVEGASGPEPPAGRGTGRAGWIRDPGRGLRLGLRRASPALLAGLLGLSSVFGPALGQGPGAHPAAFHVHSRFSSGLYEISELARIAVGRGMEVLIVSDSLLTTVVYGAWPLQRIGLPGLNKSVRPGVLDHGVEAYLEAIQEAAREFPELTLVPAVEVAPYYYWTGNPWTGLALHDFDRHLIVMGLSPQEIRDLPVIGNATWSNTSFNGVFLAVPVLLLVLGLALLGIKRRVRVRFRRLTVYERRRTWFPGVAVLLTALLAAWNNYPFGRLYDPTSDRHDPAPYQAIIDYVRARGGVVYWSYPEARFRDLSSGGATMISGPHPEDLLLTRGYHGFEGLYGDRITATLPGNLWDRLLVEFLQGRRQHPPSVATGIDFHYLQGDGSGWYGLDAGRTILFLREKSPAAVLEAFRSGRLYATFQGGPERLGPLHFQARAAGGAPALQGGRSAGEAPVALELELDWENTAGTAAEVFRAQVICDGSLVKTLEQPLPIRWSAAYDWRPGLHYCRFKAASRRYEVLSNPVFAEVR